MIVFSINNFLRRAKRLDSELKFELIKKYFKIGFADKTENSIHMLYQKPDKDDPTPTYGPPPDPKEESV
jgi:hypothetical protein